MWAELFELKMRQFDFELALHEFLHLLVRHWGREFTWFVQYLGILVKVEPECSPVISVRYELNPTVQKVSVNIAVYFSVIRLSFVACVDHEL